jgi:PadR family transcriptional regulator PadR
VADQAQLLPGILDLLILRAVSLGPLLGYGVLLRIGQISAIACALSQQPEEVGGASLPSSTLPG